MGGRVDKMIFTDGQSSYHQREAYYQEQTSRSIGS
jgi:hypothetical protein